MVIKNNIKSCIKQNLLLANFNIKLYDYTGKNFLQTVLLKKNIKIIKLFLNFGIY